MAEKQQRRRIQSGQILQLNGRWYVRYYERQNVNGELVRQRKCHCLGPITTRGKTAPDEITDAAARHMRGINECTIPTEQIVDLTTFVETIFLPAVKRELKPSTNHGYESAWRLHLRPLVKRERCNLKDVKTCHVQRWLDALGREELARNSLKRIKSLLSGIFKEARRLGYLDTINPAMDTKINPHAAPPARTFAYTLEQIQSILAHLPEPAATVFAVASFAGLRRGEIEGLQWGDFYDGELHVRRSIWNGRAGEPKTEASRSAVPVIRPLAERLELHRMRSGNPSADCPLFATSTGKPLSMNNLIKRVIEPALSRCSVCGLSEGKPHLKARDVHEFVRDTNLAEWWGLHASRRGLGSNLYALGVADKTIQAILRHANLNITLGYYVKTRDNDVTAAMGRLEKNIAEKTLGQNLAGSVGTVKTNSGAMPGFVN